MDAGWVRCLANWRWSPTGYWLLFLLNVSWEQQQKCVLISNWTLWRYLWLLSWSWG